MRNQGMKTCKETHATTLGNLVLEFIHHFSLNASERDDLKLQVTVNCRTQNS